MLIAVVVIGVLLAGILAYAGTRPDTFRVARTEHVQTPPESIFPLIEDLRNWASWSPFDKLDPAMRKTFSGAPSGKGAVTEWSGNKRAGAGRMEIIEVIAPSLVRVKLDFLKPFEGHNTSEFVLEPKGGSTEVTWAMYGPQRFVFKVMSIFASMDKMLGKEFTEGLANLKAVAEGKQSFSTKGA